MMLTMMQLIENAKREEEMAPRETGLRAEFGMIPILLPIVSLNNKSCLANKIQAKQAE